MTTETSLATAIATNVVVLDGGLATQLEVGGADLSDNLWSARLLRDDPQAIVDVHRRYFEAGAQVATTASYQASVSGFVGAGVPAEQASALIASSVSLAKQARDQAKEAGGDNPRWVAASVGPYGAVLADGSEYRGDYGLTVGELREFHRGRLHLLAAAEPDVLSCETIPCLAEVEALLSELDELRVPAWLSLSVSGGRTRAGEPIADAFAMAADVPSVIAVGVNCCHPDEVLPAIAAAKAVGLTAVAYPNSGEVWDATARRWTGTPGIDPALAAQWMAAGARLVGGCCRLGPADITAIAACAAMADGSELG